MVVDDSPTIRGWLSFVIDKDPRLNVVAKAATADEARHLIKATAPDVLTLDLEMPQMNGLDFLRHLMRLHPMPVIVLSSLVAGENKVVAAAMKLGAVDCIAKPERPEARALSELCDRLVLAANVANRLVGVQPPLSGHIALLGASTGGVAAIETVLTQFPANSPPIVIAQHMPQRFLESFAERLNRVVDLSVQLAQHGEELRHGHVHLAPALNRQTCVEWRDGTWLATLDDRTEDEAFCPSVDRLFFSAVPWAERVGALLLTGLGEDGARGMLSLMRNGARTVGQSQDSCVVYGMPGAARALGAVESEVDLRVAGTTLLRLMENAP